MKLRYIFQILFLLVLILVTDCVYNLREYSQSELTKRAEQYYSSIEEIPAVMIVTEENSETIYENLCNLYFVGQVNKQNKAEIIEMLSSQYRLDEANSLMNELNLPAVLEIQFIGEVFTETESSLFLQATEKEEGVFQVVYTEDNYRYYWQKNYKLLEISRLIEDYWQWIYWVLAGITLLIAVYFRISYEIRQSHYWQIYSRAGGNLVKEKALKIINSIVLVFVPLILAAGTEYYLWISHIIDYTPDFRFQIIRAAALLAGSLLSLIFIRRESYD